MFFARIARQSDVCEFLFALNGFLAQHCGCGGVSHRVSIVVEELVVNAFWHGAAENAGGVEVELVVDASGSRGSLRHDGAPFDPDAAPPSSGRAADDALAEQPSGNGLRIARAFTSALVHTRCGDTNHVRFEIAAE